MQAAPTIPRTARPSVTIPMSPEEMTARNALTEYVIGMKSWKNCSLSGINSTGKVPALDANRMVKNAC